MAVKDNQQKLLQKYSKALYESDKARGQLQDQIYNLERRILLLQDYIAFLEETIEENKKTGTEQP